MNGIVDVITLLLGLSGFGLAPNPKAPTPDASLEYAIPDPDIVVHLDAASLIPGNYKKLVELADQPQIQASPDLAKAVRKAVTEVESVRGLAKSMTGIDLTTDVSDATAFIQIVQHKDPVVVVAVHGKFSLATIEKIGGVLHKQEVKTGSAAWIDTGDGMAVAVTSRGVLLGGTTGLIGERVATTWKAPPHGAGTNLGYAAEALAGKPVFAFAMTLSQAARAEVSAGIGGMNFATDIVQRHKLLAFDVYHDGIGWTWIDSTRPGLDAMAEISSGTVELLRASQMWPRGVAKMLLGGLESYRGTSSQVDELLRHKPELQKLIEAYTGDGSFKAKIDTDPKTLRLSARLTGKTASEVFPFAVVIPFAVIGFVTERSATQTTTAPPVLVAPPLPPASGKKPHK
jgi:hypothetical protein